MDQEPLSYSYLTYLFVFVLSIFGSIANYLQEIKIGNIKKVSFLGLFIDVFISAFAGLITFYLCEWSHINEMLEAALIGISGHMGSRSIFVIRAVIDKRTKALGIDD